MMKNVYRIFWSFALLTIFPALLVAQIPNAGFEDWNGDEPDGWYTLNIPPFPTITETSDSHSGTSAMKGEVVEMAGMPLGPGAVTGTIGNPTFSVFQRYVRLTGYYKYTPVGDDYLAIGIDMRLNNVVIGSGSIDLPNAASTYTPFSIDIDYFGPDVPDAASIALSITNTTLVSVGSSFFLDDLELDAAVGIENDDASISAKNFSLGQNYPNPFNPSTTFKFSIPRSAEVQLVVYNLAGQEMATVVDERMAAGSHQVGWSAHDLPSGVYAYRLFADGFTATSKLVLIK